MLNSTYKISYPVKKGSYDLELPIDDKWKANAESGRPRVLLVLETVDSQDLRAGALLSDRSRTVVTNLLTYCLQQLPKHEVKRHHAFAAINFNDVKFLDQDPKTWGSFRSKFAKRVESVIEDLDPTHVVVFGDRAAAHMFPEIDNLTMKRGWVHRLKIGGKKRFVTTSLDLEALYSARKGKDQVQNDDDDDDEEGSKDVYGKANLLFYVSRNVTNALASRNLYDLSHIVANPKVIDTIEKFDAFYAKLITKEAVALDTECKNLSNSANAIEVMQFAWSTKRGYVVPIDHEQTPFSEDEREYIKKKIRAWIRAEKGKYALKYLITQYGMFDLRICRETFRLPILFHDVWEITAGEWVLDENNRYLNDFGTPAGGLAQIFCNYGNDFYLKGGFKKSDRGNTALSKLDNPDFVLYCAMDVQSIFGIHEQQLCRARHLELGDESFEPYFLNMVLKQMSNTVHVLSHMMQRGNNMDMMYLAKLKGKDSPLRTLIAQYASELAKYPEVKKANKRVVQESGSGGSKGIFGKVPWTFSWTKGDHRQLLFFTILGLKPLTYTKKKSPQVNKNFIKHYAADNEIVAKYGEWSKLTKLYGTYVKGWWNKIKEDIDSALDGRLRPSYGYFTIVTGRLNSFDPSLQQVPTRTKEAKYVKRAFTAPVGCLHIKFDCSAHEVRCWSYAGNDKTLADVFKIGQRLRQIYRVVQEDWLKALIKVKGDIHIINVKFFFGQDVDKEHPLRDAIKAVIFGVIYGKGPTTLAKDVKNTKEFAQELMAKLFGRFRKASKWLDWAANFAKENYYCYSPLGGRRNLFAMMTGIQTLIAAMARRAKNSPIQGMASQIGVTMARLIALELYKVLKDLDLLDKKAKYLPSEPLKAVHDALYSETPYKFILIYLHVVQYMATYGVTEYYEKEFGVKFLVEPEIEIEIGPHEAAHLKWDWSDANLEEILKKSLEEQKAIGYLKDDPAKAFDEIMWAYRDKRVKSYLTTNYPILGVTKDMTKQLKLEAEEWKALAAAESAAKDKESSKKKEKA